MLTLLLNQPIPAGTLAATEAKDTASVSGVVVAIGSLGATEAKDTAAVVATAGSSGSLTSAEAQDAVAVSGDFADVGSVVATEAKDTAALSGTYIVSGSLAATEAADSASLLYYAWDPATASPQWTLSNNNLTATTTSSAGGGNVGVRSNSNKPSSKYYVEVTPGAVVTFGFRIGVVNSSWIVAGGAISTGGDSTQKAIGNTYTGSNTQQYAIDFGAQLFWRGDNGTFTGDPVAGTGGTSFSGIAGPYFIGLNTVAVALPSSDSATVNFGASPFVFSVPSGFTAWNGTVPNIGALAATEAQDVAAFATTAQGDLAATEAKDAASFSASYLAPVTGTLGATEAKDVASFVSNDSEGSLAATEAKDVAAVSVTYLAPVIGTLAATEAKDTAALGGAYSVAGSLAATEGQDVALISALLLPSGDLAATENRDTSAVILSFKAPRVKPLPYSRYDYGWIDGRPASGGLRRRRGY